MTLLPPRRSAPDEDPRAAIAGLGHDLEVLRRRIDDQDGLGEQVHDLASVVAELAERLAVAPPAKAAPVTWLGLPLSADDAFAHTRAAAVLDDLIRWVATVLLRYPDAVTALPECWMWHPDVVEELLWLRQAWASAYGGPAGTVLAAGDWHDRSRPGAVRRIRSSAATCAPERHPEPATVTAVVAWWTSDRRGPR
jgi:hypothetical protein